MKLALWQRNEIKMIGDIVRNGRRRYPLVYIAALYGVSPPRVSQMLSGAGHGVSRQSWRSPRRFADDRR